MRPHARTSFVFRPGSPAGVSYAIASYAAGLAVMASMLFSTPPSHAGPWEWLLVLAMPLVFPVLLLYSAGTFSLGFWATGPFWLMLPTFSVVLVVTRVVLKRWAAKVT